MKRIIGIIASCAIVPFALSCSGGKTAEENYVKASEGVLTRTMGKLENVSLQMSSKTAEGLARYAIEATPHAQGQQSERDLLRDGQIPSRRMRLDDMLEREQTEHPAGMA